MTAFTFHDEGDYAEAAALLGGWLPRVEVQHEHHLGPSRAGADEVHVVLSPTTVHEGRFPRRSGEVEQLNDDPGAPPPPPAQAEFYAHGIATTARAGLGLPPEVPEGAPVICLDVDRALAIEGELQALPYSVLASTAAHELAHMHRGHIQRHTERSTATFARATLNETAGRRSRTCWPTPPGNFSHARRESRRCGSPTTNPAPISGSVVGPSTERRGRSPPARHRGLT